MKTEILNDFQGKHYVRHVISDNGTESWLTQEVSFADETCAKGACKLNTVENDTKHVLFLFNNEDEEVGRYYIGKSLQGKTPEQIVELKEQLYFLECWNPLKKQWVPCVGFRKSAQLSQSLMENAINQVSPNQKDALNDASVGTNTQYEYTEEMFKQEIADQEERDLLEYGTTDEMKIAQIKKDKIDNRNFWIFIILLGVIMYMIMGGIARCTGSKFDPFEDNDTEWQYKHTDRHY
jgi:hypothetical protein